jgi:hypothetical protein
MDVVDIGGLDRQGEGWGGARPQKWTFCIKKCTRTEIQAGDPSWQRSWPQLSPRHREISGRYGT